MTAQRPARSPRPCKQCGKSFVPPVVPGPPAQCCSDECRTASAKERRRLVRSRQPSGAKRVSAVCGVCGTRFSYVQKARARKYCSTACKWTAAKRLQRKRLLTREQEVRLNDVATACRDRMVQTGLATPGAEADPAELLEVLIRWAEYRVHTDAAQIIERIWVHRCRREEGTS